MELRLILALVAVMVAGVGCSSLPVDLPRTASHAVPASRDSELGNPRQSDAVANIAFAFSLAY
jgi:hypothetical protein